MYIERLFADGFRNLAQLEWRPHRHFNLLTGDNGQGKTNTLEAISLAAGLRSFRTARLTECIGFSDESATVALQIQRGRVGVGAPQQMRCDLALKLSHKSGRKLFIDSKTAENVQQYLGRLVTVLFSPADLALPHAEPTARRKYLDRVVFNHHPQHLTEMRHYERVLTSRNTLLKQARGREIDVGLLDVYDQMLAQHGAQVLQRRVEVVQLLAPLLADAFVQIAAKGLQAQVQYQAKGIDLSGDFSAQLLQALQKRRSIDRQLGYTTRGPHRDDLALLLDGRPAQIHASQGQCRALVLALKITEIRSLEAALGEPPVLLMDDVSSELDAERNRALMHYLDELGGQVILTTTDANYIRIAAPRQIFHIQSGSLTAGPVFERGA